MLDEVIGKFNDLLKFRIHFCSWECMNQDFLFFRLINIAFSLKNLNSYSTAIAVVQTEAQCKAGTGKGKPRKKNCGELTGSFFCHAILEREYLYYQRLFTQRFDTLYRARVILIRINIKIGIP